MLDACDDDARRGLEKHYESAKMADSSFIRRRSLLNAIFMDQL
jgi:hypothetical protein